MDYNSPNVAISRIVEHDVSSIIVETQLILNHSESSCYKLVLVVRKIAQADLMNIRHKYREIPAYRDHGRLSNESGFMSACESDGVVVVVLGSDVGLRFAQDFRAKLIQQR